MTARIALTHRQPLEELRRRGWAKIDLGQGLAPHAEGRFATPDGRLALRSDRLADSDVDPLPHYAPPAEVADASPDWHTRPPSTTTASSSRRRRA